MYVLYSALRILNGLWALYKNKLLLLLPTQLCTSIRSMLSMAFPTRTVSMPACITYTIVYVYNRYGLCCPWQLDLPTVLCTSIRSMLSMASPTYTVSMAACFTYSLEYVYTVYAVYSISHIYSPQDSLHYLQSCVSLYGLCCQWHLPHIHSPWQLALPTVLLIL